MPSKLKRPRSHRPFAQRPSTNSKQDQICQTDDDLLLNLQITNDLQKQGTSSNETSPNDFFKRQLILSSYIKKLSKENLELKNKLSITNSKLYSIKNKLTIHKTENEANRRHLMDNLAALSLDQNNAKKQLNDKINKFYINFHEEQQRTFNKLKIKEGKLIKLKSEKDETTFQLENVLNAFQVQTRLLEVARKEAFNAREENKETLQKLNDKLYLTSKQRCTNCEVKQKIQVKLTDDVADLTNKLNLKEQELIERKRINQILAEKLEGKKEELIKQELKAKKELEEANNLKIIYSKKIKEFELKLNKTEEERLKLLKNLENENNRTTSVIRQLIPEPCGLTPPEEIDKSPLQNNDIIDDYNKSINNNLNKKQIQSSNNSYIISKKLNSEPPPEKIQKTSHHQIANEWRAVLDLADSLDFTQQNKNNNLQQPRISPLTTIPRMPAKTITKNKINKQQKQQLPPTNIKNQSNKNINQMNGIKNQFNSQSSSSNNLRITGIRVHERFPPPSKEQSNIQINQHIQYQAIRPPNIIQQNHQQQPIIPHLINQQNLTKINNFTVINNQLPWHGGTIIRQQTSKEPPPKLYRSFI